MKNRLYFSKEKNKVEMSYILYSLRKKYCLTVKNADSDFLMFSLRQLLQLHFNYSQHIVLKTF